VKNFCTDFLSNGKDKAFAKLFIKILNQVLPDQSSEQIGAEPYGRTNEGKGHRNGYRDRPLVTRVGSLTLRVPRHSDGLFSTELFARYQRSEQSLVLARMEIIVNSLSTRKVKSIK